MNVTNLEHLLESPLRYLSPPLSIPAIGLLAHCAAGQNGAKPDAPDEQEMIFGSATDTTEPDGRTYAEIDTIGGSGCDDVIYGDEGPLE